jgi:hypothetical protein
MNPIQRRILMMSIIITLGIVLILLDVSLIFLLGITSAIGILLLGVGGS